MSVLPPAVNTLPPEAERRRSQRVLLAIPVGVAWTTNEGKQVKEHAETEVVNAHGALLRMKSRLMIPLELELSHPRTQQSTRARVVKIAKPAEDGSVRFTVELGVPSYTFWGVSIPPLSGHAQS